MKKTLKKVLAMVITVLLLPVTVVLLLMKLFYKTTTPTIKSAVIDELQKSYTKKDTALVEAKTAYQENPTKENLPYAETEVPEITLDKDKTVFF